MKRKLSVNHIAAANLRQHKRQYIALLLSTILAISFASAVVLFGSSISMCKEEIFESRFGAQDIIFVNVSSDKKGADALTERGLLKEYGTAKILGYAAADRKSAFENRGFSVAVYDKIAQRLAKRRLLEGRLPSHAGEIAIEQAVLSRLKNRAKIGQTIQLTVRIADGTGFSDRTVKKVYQLTGILSDRAGYVELDGEAPERAAFPAGVLSEEEQIETGGKPLVNFYADLPERLEHYQGSAEEWSAIYDAISCDSTAGQYLKGDIETQFSDINQTISLLITVGIVLAIACCLGIVNAFTANLQQRQQQISMLRAVAATKRQIRQIFGREAVLIALLSALPGIGLAVLVVLGLLELMGPDYHFVVHVPLLFGTAAISFAVILLAAGIPLMRFSRISPMQAIRGYDLARRMKKCKVHTKKCFCVPKHVAQRNLKLYYNNRVGITAMLMLSIFIMSLLCFTGRLNPGRTSAAVQGDFNLHSGGLSYDLASGMMEQNIRTQGIMESGRQELMTLPLAERVEGVKYTYVKTMPKQITEYLSLDGAGNWACLANNPRFCSGEEKLYLEESRKNYQAAKQKFGDVRDYYVSRLYAHDDSMLSLLSDSVIEGEIHLDKIASGDEVIVCAPTYIGVPETGEEGWSYYESLSEARKHHSEQNIFENNMFHAGDQLTLSFMYQDESKAKGYVRVDKTVIIGAVVSFSEKLKEVGWPMDYAEIATSIAGMGSMGVDINYASLTLFLADTPDETAEAYISERVNAIAARTSGVEMKNNIALARTERNDRFAMQISGLAVIVLFFAACFSMINSAISARIQAGCRSIGLLRAVGASEHEIYRSYLYQLAHMFVRGVALGMAVELPVMLFLQSMDINKLDFLSRFAGDDVYNMVYEFFTAASGRWGNHTIPIWQPLLFAALLFSSCCITVRKRLKRIMKESVVDNIRELG